MKALSSKQCSQAVFEPQKHGSQKVKDRITWQRMDRKMGSGAVP